MESIRLINYKCFDDTGEIVLKPINFLVGSNSSGKSSLLEFLPLFQQSMYTVRDGAFLWVGNNIDANDFHTVLKNGRDSMGVEINVRNIPISIGAHNGMIPELTDVKISIKISESKYGDDISKVTIEFCQQKIELRLEELGDDVIINGESMKVEGEDISHRPTNSLLPCIFINNPLSEEISPKRRQELYSWVRKNLKNEETSMPVSLLCRLRVILNKENFRRRLNGYKKDDIEINDFDHIYNLALLYNLNEIIDIINIYMMDQADKIEFIRPLRATAERYYRKRNISVNRITPNGDNIAIFFLRLKKENKLKDFNDWLQNNDMGFVVNLEEEGGMIEMKIVEDGKDGRNIVDVGFGYSQIIPILATMWKDIYYASANPNRVAYCKTSIVLIEQPELHLHPRFQRKFAQLLVKCVDQAVKEKIDLRFVIETHSQDIINSVGRSVAYKEITASYVNIYIFNAQKEDMKHYIEKAFYTHEGFLENWPIGFFE